MFLTVFKVIQGLSIFSFQGFIFSEDEPMALLQREGGPCAIIAPLQAFILKNLLFSGDPKEHWRQIEGIVLNCMYIYVEFGSGQSPFYAICNICKKLHVNCPDHSQKIIYVLFSH